MFFHFVHVIILGCFLFILPANAFPQERVLSLREVTKQAMSGNPEMRANERALSAHMEDIGIAKSFLLPKLIFEERFMRTNNPTYAFMAKLNRRGFRLLAIAMMFGAVAATALTLIAVPLLYYEFFREKVCPLRAEET